MTADDIVVRLEPHKGFQSTPFGDIEVTLPQHVIFVNDVWAGYVGDHPGAHISLILSNVSESLLQAIKAKVDAIKGDVSETICQASTPEQNDIKPADQDDDGEPDDGSYAYDDL